MREDGRPRRPDGFRRRPPAGADVAGASPGTPLYLAPEMLAGGPATPRSDIYSLGVLLFHLVTAVSVRARGLDELRAAHADG